MLPQPISLCQFDAMCRLADLQIATSAGTIANRTRDAKRSHLVFRDSDHAGQRRELAVVVGTKKKQAMAFSRVRASKV